MSSIVTKIYHFCVMFSFPPELLLEPQLPDKDFREKSEQPSEHEQISCRVLPGETSDEVCVVVNKISVSVWLSV